ncbi:putative pentatricopeptide repeat-containing protein At5g40405 [Amaranthus tricolor]|uniref:putative pentatricopeptide repeat-containing protein At5g40405 n=1 Tax=Amaranthus tricolor TaxID=29722 RepID=UPI0025899865|nr:putative pentatricopeptide repeat-containing protein At5g40405 [Amaranthus tricolor]
MTFFGSKNYHLKSSKLILHLLDHHQWLTIPQLKQIQSHLIVSGTISDSYAAGKLVFAFANHPTHLSNAYQLLIRSPNRSSYMWNTLIKFFIDNNEPTQAISLYKNMFAYGSYPNNYTFSFVIRACNNLCDLSVGLMLHAQAIRLGWESYDFVQNGLIHLYSICDSVDLAGKLFGVSVSKDVVTWTAVINGYVKAGRIIDARELFDKMPERNVVSWSAMITGYAQMGLFKEALELFNDMQKSGFRPNHSSLVGALTACAALGALDQGRWIHAFVDRNRMELDVKLATALVNMYAKCGCIEMANRVFENMPSRDVFAFTSLISALSNHGQSERAIELFKRMQFEEVTPNEVTFVCVLAACSRMGLIDEGLRVFESMKNWYGIDPGIEHYGCLVDLLARSGMLQEAEQLVRKMSMVPDSYVLGAILNACRLYGNVELGEDIVQQLSDRGLDYSGVHTLLSNIYASAKKWDGVTHVREQMHENMVRKVPGCSLIEVDGVVSEFRAGKRSRKQMEDIISTLLHMDKHFRSFQLDHSIVLG